MDEVEVRHAIETLQHGLSNATGLVRDLSGTVVALDKNSILLTERVGVLRADIEALISVVQSGNGHESLVIKVDRLTVTLERLVAHENEVRRDRTTARIAIFVAILGFIPWVYQLLVH